jgi:hypothetical protein
MTPCAGVWYTTFISSNSTGPARRVCVTTCGGVARATFNAPAPKALATNTAVNVSLIFIRLIFLPSYGVCAAIRAAAGRSASTPEDAAGYASARTPDGAAPLLHTPM